MVDFSKNYQIIEISEKVDKHTLTTDSVMFHSLLDTELYQREFRK